jgi:hypothetical protein
MYKDLIILSNSASESSDGKHGVDSTTEYILEVSISHANIKCIHKLRCMEGIKRGIY